MTRRLEVLGMKKLLAPRREGIYTLLRVVAGLMFAAHGSQKLFGAFGGSPVGAGSFMSMAGVIELAAGVLIALGLLTRPLAFLASGEMAVAFFVVHAPKGPWPIENGGELAVLYSFLFLYVAARGAGAFSLDAILSHSRVSDSFRLKPRPI
jgi:putative oxidoreductase